MDMDLRDLYQQVILDHNRTPRNYGCPDGANKHAEGMNPLCGDRCAVHLALDDGVIRDIGFEGDGCAISKASASLMTCAIKGRTTDEAEALFQRFHAMVTGGAGADADGEDLGPLAALEGVKAFPVRVKCASLAWHAMRAALADRPDVVSTE